jgi:hypothetical protein
MSKNMTRKGLAFGAGLSLVASGFVGVPATALGLADNSFIELLPQVGTEYSVLADQYFDLRANPASTISAAGPLKFLVEDTSSKTKYDVDANGATNDVNAALVPTAFTAVLGADAGTTKPLVVTVTLAAHGFKADDLVTTAGLVLAAVYQGSQGGTDNTNSAGSTTAANAAINAAITVTSATVDTFTYTVNVSDYTASVGTFSVSSPTATGTLTAQGLNTKAQIEARVLGSRNILGTTVETQVTNTGANGYEGTYAVANRVSAADGTYVIDTSTTGHSVYKTVRLVNPANTATSVKVTAWVDANDNGSIDTTEYASATRTVNFVVAATGLTVTTALSPIVGDTKLVATVTTSPTLNGEQVDAQSPSFLNVAFARQDNAAVLYANDSGSLTGGDRTASWNDTTKSWTVQVLTDAEEAAAGSSTVDGDTNGPWVTLVGAATGTLTSPTHVGGVLTATVSGHNLRVGDKIILNGSITSDVAATQTLLRDGVAKVIASVPSATTFTIAVAGASAIAGTLTYTIGTFATGTDSIVDRVFPGTYSAQAYVNTVLAGAKASSGTVSVTSAKATLSTVGSATVQALAASDNTANANLIKSGTTSVAMSLQALTTLDAAVSAGRPVVVSAAAFIGGAAAVGTFKINGLSSPVTLYTDANGQVSFTVTETAGLSTAQVRISAVVEGAVTVGSDLDWASQVYSLVDYGTTAGSIAADAAIARTTTSSGSYTLGLAVNDQWFQAASSDVYRLVVTGSGVTEKIHTLTATGSASVVVTDSGITAVGGTFTSTIAVQKLTGATWANTSSHALTTTVASAPTVVLGGQGSTLYQPAGSTLSADLTDLVAAKALVEIDKRSETTATPTYTNNVVVQGMVRNASTSVDVENAYVTISGPSNILFTNGNVAARGSLTFLSDTDGEFEVILNSTSAQTDSVITVTTMGTSVTTKVTFTGIGVGEGTSFVITVPAAVKPASTFQVKAKLTDVYGNGVAAAAGRVKVTYTGAGIVFGTLPTSTNSSGELSFAVLLGSNDSGTVSVTVSYDQNGDTDFVDAKDLTATSTTEITATGVVASAEKVNVGSFKGYVALYAKGYEGKKMSAIVAGKWIVVASLATDFERVVRYTGAGYDIVTTIYIDGVMVQTFNVTTK